MPFLFQRTNEPDQQKPDTLQNYNKVEVGFWDSMKHPDDNPPSADKIELGERLFYDPALSSDYSTSCASCHEPSIAFADSVPFSIGAKGRRASRNSPSIVNVGFMPHFMAEGAVKNLELQVVAPIQNELEMDFSLIEVCNRLNEQPAYRQAFKQVWQDSATPFTLTRSIAAYERTIVGGTSPYDSFIAGDESALNANAEAGRELFFTDRLGCAGCHSGELLSNFKIENNGLDSIYEDNGLFRLTLKQEDQGRFKVPSLRNVALTAPYMHDGRFETLIDVILHYESGGASHPNKSDKLRHFELSPTERADVISFLESLTDKEISY